jgi:hypothetical protein
MMTEKLTKMRFDMSESQGYESSAEWLWVKSLPDGSYVVDSIPFEMMGVSADDVVSGFTENGHLNFKGILKQSGNRTIRIKFRAGQVEQIIEELGLKGVEFEGSQLGNHPLYAFNVPSSMEYTSLKAKMTAMEASGKIEFEEGNA